MLERRLMKEEGTPVADNTRHVDVRGLLEDHVNSLSSVSGSSYLRECCQQS